MCIKYPKLEQHIIKEDIIKIAINLEYVTTNKRFTSKDEIALFPPVSGGWWLKFKKKISILKMKYKS